MPDSVTVALFHPGPLDSAGTMVTVGRYRRAYLTGHPWPRGPIPTAQVEASLAPTTQWIASGDRLWVVDAESGGVTAFDRSGGVLASDTLPLVRRPFDPQAVARARSAALAAAPDDYRRAAIEAVYDPRLLPPMMPLFDALVPGHDGGIWVRLFALSPQATREYLVLGSDARALARVLLPADVTVHQVGADFVLGVRRTEDGLEEVVQYRLSADPIS